MCCKLCHESHRTASVNGPKRYLDLARLQGGEHALRRVEGVSPVVVGHVLPVVLLHTQNPPAENLRGGERTCYATADVGHTLTHRDQAMRTAHPIPGSRGRGTRM